MPRAKTGATSTRHHRKILQLTRGYRGAASRWYRNAIAANMRAERFSAMGRKLRKRDFRALWITRISAACRMRGVTYSRFIAALAGKAIEVNRKMLAELAVSDPNAFDRLLAVAMRDASPDAAISASAPAAPVAETAPAAEVEAAPAAPAAKKKRTVKKAKKVGK